VSRNRPIIIFTLLVLAIIAGLSALVWANYRYTEANPGGVDYLPIWIATHQWMLEGTSPYDRSVSSQAQEIIYGRPADPLQGDGLHQFLYPLTSMVFFAPFGMFDFPLSRALWMTLLELGLAALAYFSIRLVDWKATPQKVFILMLFSILWIYGMRAVVVGQFSVFEAMLIVGALLLIHHDQDALAGLLLAFATTRSQLIILILPLTLLWAYSRRRTRIIGGYLLSLLVLLLISLFFIPKWPLQLSWQLIEFWGFLPPADSLVALIAGAVPGLSRQLGFMLRIFLVGYLIFEWVLVLGKDENWFMWTALLTLLVTNFIARRPALTDYIILLPAIFLFFKTVEGRFQRVGKYIVWGVLLLFLFGFWLIAIGTEQPISEHPVLLLLIPLFSLLGLWWVRWWTIRPMRLPLDEIANK